LQFQQIIKTAPTANWSDTMLFMNNLSVSELEMNKYNLRLLCVLSKAWIFLKAGYKFAASSFVLDPFAVHSHGFKTFSVNLEVLRNVCPLQFFLTILLILEHFPPAMAWIWD
jgi:hypothetical protein